MQFCGIQFLLILWISSASPGKVWSPVKSEMNNYSNLFANRNIIIVGKNDTSIIGMEGENFVACTRNFSGLLKIPNDSFLETTILLTDISLIQNISSQKSSERCNCSTRYFILLDGPINSETIHIVEHFALQNLPELTDIFFGNPGRFYGMSCIKNSCLSMVSEDYFKRPKTFQGVQLKLAIVIFNYEDMSPVSLVVYKATQDINVEHLIGIQFILNFTVEIHPAMDWASLNDDGSWTGMAKLVDSREVDLALSRSYLLPFRVQHFRFLVVVYTERLMAYYHPPEKQNIDILELTFDIKMFLVRMFLLLVASLMLKWACELDIIRSIMIVVGSMTQQGLSAPKSMEKTHLSFSSELLSLILNLGGLLFYTGYAALLVSAFSIDSNIIRDLEDLVKRGYTFGTLNDSYLRRPEVLSGYGKNTVLASIIENLDPTQKYANLDQGSQTVLRTEKFAFLSEINLYSMFRSRASNKDICNGVMDLAIPEEQIKSSAFLMKDSPYYEYLNYAYLKMWETGMTPALWKRDASGTTLLKPPCTTRSKIPTVVDLRELRFVFLIPLIGILLSLLAILIEKTHWKTTNIKYKLDKLEMRINSIGNESELKNGVGNTEYVLGVLRRIKNKF